MRNGQIYYIYTVSGINIEAYEQNQASPIYFTAKLTIGFLRLELCYKIWPKKDSERARLADQNSVGTIFHQFYF